MTKNGKYLFFDIDGTLEGKSRRIVPATRLALEKARQAGHKIFVCTGRTPSSIVGDVTTVAFDGIVCGAGSFLRIGDEYIYEHYIDKAVLKKVMDLFESHHIMFSLEAKDAVYQSPGIEAFFQQNFEKRIHMNPELARYHEMNRQKMGRAPLSLFDIEQTGVAKMGFVAEDKAVFDACAPVLSELFHIVLFSKPEDPIYHGEIILKDCTKGDGIKRIMNYFGADIEDSIGFGDSMNDYQMLSVTHTGAVFEGAPEELKRLAQYYFSEPDEGGIARVMEEMNLI